jgi:tetratricopeptide (TPR) repeat protein
MRTLISTTLATTLIATAFAALAESAAPPAPAEPATEFDAVVARAVEAYSAQRYDEAIALFEQAWAMRQQPEIIYNIARVYERAVRRPEAIERYEQFLSMPNTTAELRARAMTSLEALRTELEAMERASRRGTEPEGPETPPVPPTPPEEPVDALNVSGWVLFGTGAAVLIAGGVLGGLALGEQNAAEEAGSLADQQDHFDRGETEALTADILFGTGGALAVTGVILLIVRAARANDHDQPAADAPVSLRPTFAGHGPGVGLTLDGRF